MNDLEQLPWWKRLIWFRNDLYYTQAKNCRFCLHIGTCVWYFFVQDGATGPRLELFTLKRRFRWSSGKARRRIGQ